MRPLLSITFPQGFQKSKMFGYKTVESGGKKMFKRSTQMKKIPKKTFLPQRFYTLYEQKLSNLRPLLSITKKFGPWILGKGGKMTFKWSEKHSVRLSKAQFAPKLKFF